MKQLYAVYAYDNMFGGLHGMCDCQIISADSIEEAEEEARGEMEGLKKEVRGGAIILVIV